MELKEVYEKLEKMEGGAEMITAVKAECNRLANEAKTHRQNGDKSAAKVKSLLESLGLEDAKNSLTRSELIIEQQNSSLKKLSAEIQQEQKTQARIRQQRNIAWCIAGAIAIYAVKK